MTNERPSGGPARPPAPKPPEPPEPPAPRPGGTERIEKSWNPEKKSGQ